MKERVELPASVSIDSGVILAYLLGERSGELVRTRIFNQSTDKTTKAYCSGSTVAETFYILCRRRGPGYAQDTIATVLESGYLSRVSSNELDVEAGRYKCARGVSLADCYVLATAKLMDAAALFARREDDIKRESERDPFDVQLIFLEDLRS